MPRSPRWSRTALVAVTTIVLAACTGATPSASAPAAPSAAQSAPASAPASAAASAAPSRKPFAVSAVYPETGEAPCGTEGYTGSMKKITAVDPLTVQFDLCGPDPAFLPKVAFQVFGIQDTDYLAAHMADKSILDQPNGTGPYKLSEWSKGNRMVFEANPDYWGAKALTPGLELHWSDEAAQRLLELQSGNVDGMDNPGADDIANIQADSSLKFNVREPLNTFYIGFNNQLKPWSNEKIRQAIAMGINRQQIVDNFYPEGSEVATHFTPCNVPFGCEGDATWDFNLDEAKRLLAEGMAEEGITSLDTKLSFRSAVRGYLPDPPQVGTEIVSQLKQNLGINATLDLMESGAFLDAAAAGTLPGIYMLGWGADYPDPTNFLDYHFGAGSGKKFGKPFDDIAAALQKGATSLADARSAGRLRRGQQPHQAARPRGHRGPRRLRHRVQGGRRELPHLAPRQRGLLGHEGGRPAQPGVRPERRAAQPLLRRRDRWRVAPRMRAGQRGPVRVRGRRHRGRPGPRRVVHAERRRDVVDLQAAGRREVRGRC